MKTSEQGKQLLIDRESRENVVYLDSKGYPTCGVGHMDTSLRVGDVWSDEKVDEVFAADLERFEKALNDNLTVCLKQHQFDALVSWLWNVGTGWASKATLIKLINQQRFDEAAAEFDKWHIPPEVTSRRNGEREQFKGTHFVARYED